MRMPRLRVPFVTPRGVDSGHTEQLRTDAELGLGPGPERIDRPQLLGRGLIGHNVNTFPMTGGLQYIGHVPLVQIRRGPSVTPGNAIDDRAAVPAIFAGNPVE